MEKPKEGKSAMSEKTSRQRSRINSLHLLAGLLATGLLVPALLGQSTLFPTYQVGANKNLPAGPNYPSTLPTPWVVSSGQIITPAGQQVYLGTTTRAKAVALNPNTQTHNGAVLQMGAPTRTYVQGLPGHGDGMYLRTKCLKMWVLMVGGLLDDNRLKNREDLEGFRVFPKPYSAAELLQKVKDVLAEPRG